MLTDTAVMIADGGRVPSDLAVVRDQGELFGPVASHPTPMAHLDDVGALQRGRLAAARARMRRHAWDRIVARHGSIAASAVADRDLGKTIVIRRGATMVIADSIKELAAGTSSRRLNYQSAPTPGSSERSARDCCAWTRVAICLLGPDLQVGSVGAGQTGSGRPQGRARGRRRREASPADRPRPPGGMRGGARGPRGVSQILVAG